MTLAEMQERFFNLPEEVIPNRFIAVIEAYDPGAGRNRLFIRADDDSPAWAHLGMVEAIRDSVKETME